MQIISKPDEGGPIVLNDDGTPIQGIESVSIKVTSVGVEAECKLCIPVVNVFTNKVIYRIIDPVSGEFKTVSAIKFADGSDWNATDHAK